MLDDLSMPFFYSFPAELIKSEREENKMSQCLNEIERQEKVFKYKIYKIENKTNRKIYIGQTTKADNINYLGSGVRINNAIKKYGRENFSRRLILRAETKQEADFMEKYFIKLFRNSGYDLYNITDGGQGGNLGAEANEKRKITMESKEYRLKMSKLKKNIIVTWGDKISKSLKGKPKSEIHRNNLSISKKGKPTWRTGTRMSKEQYWQKIGKTQETCLCGCNQICGRLYIAGHNAIGMPSSRKGLTKETDESIRRMSEKKKGKKLSQEAINKGIKTKRINKLKNYVVILHDRIY